MKKLFYLPILFTLVFSLGTNAQKKDSTEKEKKPKKENRGVGERERTNELKPHTKCGTGEPSHRDSTRTHTSTR